MSNAVTSGQTTVAPVFDIIVSDQEKFDSSNICLEYTDIDAPVQGILVHIRRAANGQAVFCRPENFCLRVNRLFDLKGTLKAARTSGNPIKIGTLLNTMPGQGEWVFADTLFLSQKFFPKHAETRPLMISAQIPNHALYELHRNAMRLRQQVFTRRTKRAYDDFHDSADWSESGVFEEQLMCCLSRKRDENLYRWYNLHKNRIRQRADSKPPQRRGW